MTKINPTILKWARETAGLTLDEASKKLGITELREALPCDRLSALENGATEPTRTMLIKMTKVYRRPLIAFYMEKPPKKSERGQDFRTLPDGYTNHIGGLVDALIRNVYVRQSIIRSALEDDDAVAKNFVGSNKLSDGIDALINAITAYTKIDIREFRNYSSPETAFKYIRNKIETAGVFVLLMGDLGSHHTALDIEVFRGFALSDEIAPFIVINDRDSKTAWSFTLIHELTHIFLGHTGISGINWDLEVEIFCNNVASNFLLPSEELDKLQIHNSLDFESLMELISEFACSQNLSNSMVAYRLFIDKKISKNTWSRLNAEYKHLWITAQTKNREKQRLKDGGPTYYTIRRHRLGENLISLVNQMIISGSITTIKASKVLGVSPKKVQKLIEPNLQSSLNYKT